METPNPIKTQEDFERVRSAFTAAQELSAQMSEENERFAEAERLVDQNKEILALAGPDVAQQVLSSAREGIAEEQGETFFDLSETMRDSGKLYEMIGILGVRLPKEIEETSESIKALEATSETKDAEHKALMQEKEEAVSAQLEAVLQNLERVSPRALPDVKTMLGDRAKGSAASDPDVQRLDDEILNLYEKQEDEQRRLAKLQEQNTRVEELYRQFGNQWERPQALIEVLGTDVSNWVLIDEMPVEPKLSTSSHERFADLRSRHIDQPEASLYTAFYLIDHAGEIATVDGIAQFLYVDEPGKTVANMRSRVTTLLGPNRDHISKILLTEGYVLQYGWRRTLGKTGASGEIKHVKPRERIYRVVSLDDPNALDLLDTTVREQGGIRDEFEVTEQMRELIIEHREAIEAIGADNSAQSSSEKTPARRMEWMRELNKKIGDAITELENENLLDSPEGEFIKLIRRRTNSRVFGTDETLQKLIDANHLRSLSTYERNEWIDVALTPAEMVLMRLYNTNKQLFAKKAPRRDAALGLIDAALSAYFENKQKGSRQQKD